MPQGPLLPGVREFDRPRGRWPAWLRWGLVSVVVLLGVVLVAGLVGGVGPLRVLGLTTVPLEARGFRPTVDPAVIQVAVALPADGLCRDDELRVVPYERGNRVEVESEVTRPRTGDCPLATFGGDVRWVDVRLDEPLGTRTVIALPERTPLPRESATP